ncbi:MAG: hypothetical protein ACM3YE_01035 [Bacteroidota bacterium]
MKNLKKVWWKVIVIVVGSGLFDMILHGLLLPLDSSDLSSVKPSIFVKKGVLVLGIMGWELLAFGVLALVFIMIQSNLPGKKGMKGFFYGLSFAGLYLIGMFESVLLWNSTMMSEFFMGLGDFIPILLMGMLLGIFAGTDQPQTGKERNLLAVLTIAFFYILGRYFSNSVLHIESAYLTKPLGTLIWTISQGIWVGIVYYILQPGTKGKSLFSQALFFGTIIFGANWLVNHLFIAVIAEISPDIFIRTGMDILFTMLGVYVYQKLFTRKLSGLKVL